MTGTQVTGQVTKRDGSLAPFDAQKIRQAIAAAGQATGEFDTIEAQHLTSGVVAHLAPLPCPGIEIIQNCVEEVLVDAGYWRTARAYIVYREQHARLRSLKHTLVDVESTMEEYLEQRDWRVNANANQGYSLGGLILNVAGKVTANYWLSHVYSPEAGTAHREGDLHIHDLDMLSGYCAGWSLRQLLTEGFNGVPGKVEATPPRHMSAAIGQIVNFLGTLQNEWAGAQAFSSFDTYMAPFIRRDAMSYAAVKQSMQELIYNLNVPSRWGTQTPFTNLTFDWTCPADLREQVPYIGGEEMPFTYGDLQPEMDMINRAYIEVMMAGDAKDRAFTFPIPTYNITSDFDWEHPNTTLLFEMTARYGLPYFQNFLNSDLEPHMVRSMCCRLQLDLRELLKRGNGLFGSAEQTGSIGVVTVNCARLGYLYAGDEAALLARLDTLLALGRDVLEVKRKFVQRLIDQGLYPYTRRYLGTLRNHFSTLGVNGINEMVRNFTHDADDITTPFGHAMAVRLLDHVRQRMTEFQEATGHLYNLEATPAEGTTYR
ncbi:MAG: ribonucleoside triphosphate reductase, partial [Ralstonia sp.]|nr:ribonucleoside triphosphate reductase [Ralstonia sp.]